jgi:MscS family membrane protein
MKRIAVILLLLVVLLPSAYAQVLPTAGDVSLRGGESATLNFSIVNPRNETVFFVINYEVPTGWKVNINPDSGVINSDSSQLIAIHIKAPLSYGVKDFKIPVKISMYDQRGEVANYNYTLHISYLSTPFYIFDIPWPESWGYWDTFLNVLITWLFITLILYLIFPYIKKVTNLTKTRVDNIIVDILHKPITLWVIFYGITTAILTIPPLSWMFSMVIEIYNILVIILVTWISYRFFKDIIIYYLFHLSRTRKGDLENVLIPILEKIGVVTIGSLGGLMILQVMGVNVGVLLASVGIAGVILGLAAQQTLGNFFSGLHILIDRAFRIGDIIMLENDDGVYKVMDVGVRSTRLYELFSNTVVFIPNSKLASTNIINFNRPNNKMKIRIDVSVSYGSDVSKVIKTLKEIALSHPKVLRGGKYEPAVIFREFGSSSLNFSLYIWIDDVMEQWEVPSEIREKIVEVFRKEGIEIPFPQLDIHIKPQIPGKRNNPLDKN